MHKLCFQVKEIIFLRQIKYQICLCPANIYFLILSWLAGAVICWFIPQVFLSASSDLDKLEDVPVFWTSSLTF